MNKIDKSLLSFRFGSNPKLNISAGATSNSESLQFFIDDINKDNIVLKAFATKAQEAYQALVSATASTGVGFQSLVSSLSARVSSLSASSMALVDMHSEAYVDTGVTTADISKVFGQATLPILEELNLLTFTDINGDTKASSEVKAWTAQTSGSTPSISSYKIFPYIQEFIEGRMVMTEELETTTGVKRYLWIRMELPYSSQYKSPTCIEIYPSPICAVEIEEIAYQAGGQAGVDSWSVLDLSYLPGYNQSLYSNSYVNSAGPIRVWLPGGVISNLRIKMSASDNIQIGLTKFRLLYQTFDNSAVLKINNPWSANIDSIVLQGKDPSNLAELSSVLNTTSATITLGKLNTGSTPVITGVLIQEQS